MDIRVRSAREVADEIGRGDVVVLDVRRGERFAEGHLPGARIALDQVVTERLERLSQCRDVFVLDGSGETVDPSKRNPGLDDVVDLQGQLAPDGRRAGDVLDL